MLTDVSASEAIPRHSAVSGGPAEVVGDGAVVVAMSGKQ